MPHATTPAQYALILIDLVESRGCDRDAVLAGTDLASSGIDKIGARISDSDFTRLVENALALTGDPALGLALGSRLNLSAHAVVGQAFMTCRDLRQVIEIFLKYYHLLAPALHVEMEIVDQYCVLTTISEPEPHLQAFMYELLYGAVLNTLRGLLGLPGLQLHLEVPFPAPNYASRYREVFGEAIRFDCVHSRISFDKTLLDTALPSSNPALRSLYEQECARLLADLEEEDSVAEQTLRLLRKLEGQYPQMPQIASILNFSPRTYRRRLESEHRSYQELLDKVRAEHATRYLQNTRLPLSTIAYMVGFKDASNFRRAYVKWTGHSPRGVRGA